MNQQQRKYLLNRIEELTKEKINNERKKYTKEGVRLDSKGIVEALKAGRFEVYDSPPAYSTGIRSYIRFTEEVEQEFDQEGFKVAEESIKAKSLNLKDEIMIGDSEKALQLLREFENL